jgi:hypothetical protein
MRMDSARYCDCPTKSRRQERQVRQAKSAGENYSNRKTCSQAEVDQRPPWTLHIKHSDGWSDQAKQSSEPGLRFPFHALMFFWWFDGNTIADGTPVDWFGAFKLSGLAIALNALVALLLIAFAMTMRS